MISRALPVLSLMESPSRDNKASDAEDGTGPKECLSQVAGPATDEVYGVVVPDAQIISANTTSSEAEDSEVPMSDITVTDVLISVTVGTDTGDSEASIMANITLTGSGGQDDDVVGLQDAETSRSSTEASSEPVKPALNDTKSELTQIDTILNSAEARIKCLDAISGQMMERLKRLDKFS